MTRGTKWATDPSAGEGNTHTHTHTHTHSTQLVALCNCHTKDVCLCFVVCLRADLIYLAGRVTTQDSWANIKVQAYGTH